jgi:hypothetical protein
MALGIYVECKDSSVDNVETDVARFNWIFAVFRRHTLTHDSQLLQKHK